MSRTWFTSDYHMGHRNIIGLCDRPFADVEEMEREIVARHNELVAPDDEVYDLGDFAYRCPPEHAADCLRRLNGRRTMLWGNHDKPLRQAFKRGMLVDLVESGKVKFIGDPDPRFQTGLRVVIDGHPVVLAHYPVAFNAYDAMEDVATGGAPGIKNDPVTDVTTGSATFHGTLTSTGSSATAVCVLWGDDDGGATWDWDNTNWFNNGEVNESWTNGTPFETNITSGISQNDTYWYTFAATNATTNKVASSSKYFITGQVTVDATVDAAQFALPTSDNGEFTIYRPLGCTNEALTVGYTMTGTAVENTDYTLSGSATFAAGDTNAVLTLAPEPGAGGTAILTLTAASGNPYPIGTANSDTVTIAAFEGKVWTGASSTNWTDGGNWAGGVPGETDDVIIDTPGGANQPTINVSGGVTIKSLTIGATTASTLTFSNGDVTSKKLTVTGDVTIGANGTLTHTANPAGAGETHRLCLDVGGNVTINQGGKISVSALGYAGDGPGDGGNQGGGYGGVGGKGGGTTYGSVTNPVNCGSGGGMWNGQVGGGPQNGSRNGRPNSGGGGGSLATGLNSNDSGGGSGGSGIVIVRYVVAASDPYEAWRQTHFTPGELADSEVSGDDADPDHDGIGNRDEYLANTIPTNGLSVLIMTDVAPNPGVPGEIIVRWQSASNRWYTLQAATNLLMGFTLDLRTNITATPMENVYTDSVESAIQKFYRVIVE